ncbi:hypothetical protein [Agromyces cerinus]|uniref:Lipoprotein n=1 Tax=Agromyces cerinus subsp. cerinus TaxID=232089 RepID=A0A1N6H906_9MICO|nr:hypothetical protein [Agromyces cerinus]SIO16147.1 hypothetical protein SAMN05443544_2984 [Agromyces cerinus subsp. cerinus]
MNRRRILPAAAFVAATLSLVGCGGITPGGQKADTASVQLLNIDGVDSGGAYADGVWAGFNHEKRIGVSVTLDPGVEPTPEFFDYLVELAWSVNDHEPNKPVSVYLRTDPQVNVREVAEGAGWTSLHELAFDEIGGPISLDDVEERFGPWPGEPPEAPTNALILPDAGE